MDRQKATKRVMEKRVTLLETVWSPSASYYWIEREKQSGGKSRSIRRPEPCRIRHGATIHGAGEKGRLVQEN